MNTNTFTIPENKDGEDMPVMSVKCPSCDETLTRVHASVVTCYKGDAEGHLMDVTIGERIRVSIYCKACLYSAGYRIMIPSEITGKYSYTELGKAETKIAKLTKSAKLAHILIKDLVAKNAKLDAEVATLKKFAAMSEQLVHDNITQDHIRESSGE
tara:strand:+ start:56 stop:523 length:468 start_codon:yes stop_codon:yes gene_type:complete